MSLSGDAGGSEGSSWTLPQLARVCLCLECILITGGWYLWFVTFAAVDVIV